ncbi:MAG: hypothetical protein IKM31_04535 [Oscillospiraceae bacterium]|nr:hypothetical protein [Oscillospiraceae bacterium]
MEDRQLESLVESIEHSSKQQLKLARLQCVLSGAAAAVLLIAAVVCCTLLPKVKDIAAELETVMINLTAVSAELEAADLGTLVQDVDALVVTGEQSVEETMKKLSAIDFETLNRAIENLADVIEPLAKFFNIFN